MGIRARMFIMAAEDITAVMAAAAVVVTVVEVEGGVRCVGDVWRREGRPDQTRGEERRGEGKGWEAVGTSRRVLGSSALSLVISTYIVYRS
jgi:hypothetical protein